jgi:hypothetical protein
MTTNAVEILKRRYYIMRTFVYMIRRKSDGLFSSGGYKPRFSNIGKMWTTLNTFHNHLALFRERYLPWSERKKGWDDGPYEKGVWVLPEAYKDCEVVTIRIVVDSAMPLEQYLKEKRPPADELRKAK